MAIVLKSTSTGDLEAVFVFGFVDGGDFVAVLHVASYARKIFDNGDSEALEFGRRAYSAQFEELRSVEGSRGNDDFFARGDVAG